MKFITLGAWQGSQQPGEPPYKWTFPVPVPEQIPEFERTHQVSWRISIPWLFGLKITINPTFQIKVISA